MHPPLAPRSRQGAAHSGRAASPRPRLQEPGTPAPTSTHSQQRSGRPRRTTSTPLEEPTETAMPPAPAPAAPAPAPEPEPPAGASMTAARSLPFGPSGRSLPAEVTTAVADAARPAGMADYLALAAEQGLELRRREARTWSEQRCRSTSCASDGQQELVGRTAHLTMIQNISVV